MVFLSYRLTPLLYMKSEMTRKCILSTYGKLLRVSPSFYFKGSVLSLFLIFIWVTHESITLVFFLKFYMYLFIKLLRSSLQPVYEIFYLLKWSLYLWYFSLFTQMSPKERSQVDSLLVVYIYSFNGFT